MSKSMLPLLLIAMLPLAACATRPAAPAPATGAHYVAMGSSYAAGPGITKSADTPPTRCARSQDNYPQQLARTLQLALTDMSCSGATTAHLLERWNELPAQLDALRPDTALVTITAGGNDIGYMTRLFAASCTTNPDAPICARIKALPPVTDAQWQAIEASFATLASQVRRRAPRARLVFVDYLSVLPETGTCPDTPLADADAAYLRSLAQNLARITSRAAKNAGADLVGAGALSRAHNACAATPWMTGFNRPTDAEVFVPYHPNAAGMTAVAQAIEATLSAR